MKKITKILTLFICVAILFSFQVSTFVSVSASSELTVDETLASTYVHSSSLVVEPSVIAKIESQNDLDKMLNNEMPATAIVSVDDNMNVVDANGQVIDAFDEIYKNYLIREIIPAVYVKTQAQVEAFLNYLSTVRNLLDIAVVSNDASLVAFAREENDKIRGIVDYSGMGVSDSNIASVVAESTASGANVVMLNERSATRENVTYLHARLKAVWVTVDAETELQVASAVSSGCYGIVTKNVKTVYSCFDKYVYGNSLARTPFNIAHRGLCISSYENSLEGYIGAYENGATHIEVDIQMTKDGHPIVMHDSTINRTTNGTGNVSNLTLEQLSQYKIIKNANGNVIGDGVAIPTLEDVFKEFAGKDVVIIVEIKTGDSRLTAKLEELMAEYECQDQIIVIAFGLAQLARMKEDLPEIPTANLNTAKMSTLVKVLYDCGTYNTVVNTGYGNADTQFINQGLRDRGYLAYFYTYGSYYEVTAKFCSGVLGMTNNEADKIGDFARELTVKEESITLDRNNYENARVNASIITYNGKEQPVQAEVFMLDESTNKAILYYCFSSADASTIYHLYSEAVKVNFSSDEGNAGNGENKGGCNSSVAGGAFGVMLLASAVAVLFKRKMR